MKGKRKKMCIRKTFAGLLSLAMVMACMEFDLQTTYADDVSLVLNGFQINSSATGFRTIYTVEDATGECAECGLLYGLKDYATDSDMYVGSEITSVYNYPSTVNGISPVNYGTGTGSKSYIMTMQLLEKEEYLNADLLVRAYAKKSDGSYVYGECFTTSIYKIANFLYQNMRMSSSSAHNNLYSKILSVVNPSYQALEYATNTYSYDVEAMVEISPDGATVTKTSDNADVTATTQNGVTTVSIQSASKVGIKGSGENVIIDVAKGMDEVALVLDNVEINNSNYNNLSGKDASVITFGKETNAKIILVGSSTLSGSNSYTKEPAAVISQKGTMPTLKILDGGSGELFIEDTMQGLGDAVEYGDVDPADGIATKGLLELTGGTIRVNVVGDALKGTGADGAGGVAVSGGVYYLTSEKSNAIKSKNGNITISGGTINSEYTGEDVLNAKNYSVNITGGNLVADNCYGDGIQGKWVDISAGNISIYTYFENAGLNYYNTALATHNSMSVSESSSSKTKVETVNIDTGSHKGIKAGKKSESYVYQSVEEGSEYTAGTTYTNEEEGGLTISGGTILINTTNTGIKYNGGGGMGGPGMGGSTSSTGNLATANNDGQYIIGAPEDGIKSNADMSITGGNITVYASDDGVSVADTLTVTGDAVLKVEQAYEGIEAGQFVVGSQGETSGPYVSVYTADDGINTAGKNSVSYVYTDETETQYTKTTVSEMSGHNMTVYSGTVVVMIADDSTKSYSLYVTDGQGVVTDGTYYSGTYTANGDGIDCNGSVYFYGGTTVVWAANSSDNSPIDTADNSAQYVIGAGATVLACGSSSSMTNNPTSLNQAAVVFSGSSVASGSTFAIADSSANAKLAAVAPKNLTYIMFTSPDIVNGSSYSLYSGGSVSNLIDAYLSRDTRYLNYNSSGASTFATATASTTITGGSGGGPGGGPGGGGPGGGGPGGGMGGW